MSRTNIAQTPEAGFPPPGAQSIPARPILSALTSLGIGILLFFGLLLASVIAFNTSYEGKIYPGISVSGIDLSGLTPVEAAALLSQQLDYPVRGQIAFQDGQNVWVAKPFELGLFLDAQGSALAAYYTGRQGGLLPQSVDQFNAYMGGVNLPPRLVYDERAAQFYLETIASQINRAVIEASLSVRGTDVIVQPGQIGRELDTKAALTLLAPQLHSMSDGLIPLTVSESMPAIMDVSDQAEIVEKILSAALTLRVPNPEEGDPGPWTFEPEALAHLLAIERVETPEGPRYQVGLNSETMRPMLESVAPQLARSPENARFIFNDDTRQLEVIQPAVIGRHLDVDLSIQTINQLAAAGEHEIYLEVAYTSPEVRSEATAEELGITELVASHTSYFFGSSSGRIQNIQLSAAQFHGLMVAPGATFSMAEWLGDITLDNGYAEALIIYGGRTIQGVGGGVCQVSTTLFRTAFFGGFPIVERYPHAYRVGYYEQTSSGGYNANLAGLDATVFVPVVDFKFRNDTPHWLLMETYTNAAGRSLTWKFYSTSDGRTVEWDSSGPRNVVKPDPPLYEENPDLRQGEIKQVDWEADGADVSVTRVVRRGDEVLYNATFNTHYLPWRAIYHYGPGTEGMPPPSQEDDD
jgi:vancomycin resistance protein YoaR